MKRKLIAMVLTAISLASFSLSSCTSSTPKEEDYYDPEHKPFGKYDEVVKVKGVMEFLAHNDSRVPSDITPETNVFIKKLKEDMNIQWDYLWKVPSTQYENRLTATMLGKQQPNILKLNGSQYQQFLFKLLNLTPGLYVGITFPKLRLFLLLIKSTTFCTGA